jgi:hypothetical protein
MAAARGIWNTHERVLDAPRDAVGALVDTLSSRDDQLWPRGRWPAMRLDRGLAVGSDGGHGPVRYAVARYEPRRRVAFAFTPAFPIAGEHRCEVLPGPSSDTTLLRHVLEGKPHGWLRLGWPLCFRWLHDALIEDAFDRAEAELADVPWQPRRLPFYVRVLRRLLSGRAAA